MAPTNRQVVTASNRPAGKLTVAMSSPDDFADRVSTLTGADVVIRSPGGAQLATTEQNVRSEKLPAEGAVEAGGVDYRARSFPLRALSGPVRVSLLMQNRQSSPTSRTSVIALAAFVAFLILASVFAVAVSRRL